MNIGHLKLHSDDVFQRGRGMDMKILRASQQAHAGQQANQPEVMIAKAHEKFDANGHFTDEAGKKLIQQLLQNLADWTRRLAK